MVNVLVCIASEQIAAEDITILKQLSHFEGIELKCCYAKEAVGNSQVLLTLPKVSPRTFGDIPVFLDSDEWMWQSMGDTVLHIDLKNWADIALVFASSHFLGKISNGLCDDLPSLVLRAWPFEGKKVTKKVLFILPEHYHPAGESMKEVEMITSWGMRVLTLDLCELQGLKNFLV
jgi:hypothetical protein